MGREVVLRVRVTGRVQGVWFRAWTRREAERLGLRGWVRNAPDGSVEALLAGRGELVADMVRLMHHGPERAAVAAVTTAPSEEAVPEGFAVEP
ncbi:acylphosphatase [Seohaeicola nanhaiensis]|uniref:Acylphosphatase n=1 Tax=Seohaeicola nanhaiensis TaxID=1387282 RepID=A0ABV9KCN7_9RHOB